MVSKLWFLSYGWLLWLCSTYKEYKINCVSSELCIKGCNVLGIQYDFRYWKEIISTILSVLLMTC